MPQIHTLSLDMILTQVQESNLLFINTFFMYLHFIDIFPVLIGDLS